MSPSAVTVLNVRHASRVAAIQTAAGPEGLLEAGLARRLGETGLPVEVRELRAPGPDVLGAVGEAFAVADAVARSVRAALVEDRLPFVLSGSCHAGLGSAMGLPDRSRGVVWLDAHGDFNTPETTGSGLVDGTTLATVTGRCWSRLSSKVSGFRPVADEDVALVGVRSLDPEEEDLLNRSGVTVLPPETVSTEAPPWLEALGRRVEGVYLHVDLDVLDTSVGRANAFAEPGGLSAQELREMVEQVVELCPVRVVGFASYDPSEDEGGRVCREALELAGAMVERSRG